MAEKKKSKGIHRFGLGNPGGPGHPKGMTNVKSKLVKTISEASREILESPFISLEFRVETSQGTRTKKLYCEPTDHEGRAISIAQAHVGVLAMEGLKGNIRAIEVLRDSSGDKPVDRIEMDSLSRIVSEVQVAMDTLTPENSPVPHTDNGNHGDDSSPSN